MNIDNFEQLHQVDPETAPVAGHGGPEDELSWPTLFRQEQLTLRSEEFQGTDEDFIYEHEPTRRAAAIGGAFSMQRPQSWAEQEAVAAELTSASASSPFKLAAHQHAMHEAMPPAAPQYLLSSAMHLTTGAPQQLMQVVREVVQMQCRGRLVEKQLPGPATPANQAEAMLDYEVHDQSGYSEWKFLADVSGRGGVTSRVAVALFASPEQRCLVASDCELVLEVTTDTGDRRVASAVRCVIADELRSAGVVVEAATAQQQKQHQKQAAQEEDPLAAPAPLWSARSALEGEAAHLPAGLSATEALLPPAKQQPADTAAAQALEAPAAGAIDWCKQADAHTAADGAELLRAVAATVDAKDAAAVSADLEAFRASGALVALGVAASASSIATAAALSALLRLQAAARAAGVACAEVDRVIAGAQ